MYIKVKVNPGARTENFIQRNPDHFEISVRQKAERNMANERVIELIADFFKVGPEKVRIVAGHHVPGKILDVGIEGEQKKAAE